MFVKKPLQIGFEIRVRERESPLGGVRREGVGKRALLHRIGAEPGPGLPGIRAYGGAAYPDRILAAERERQRTSRRAAHPKIPVKPPGRGIAQVGMQPHDIAFDALDEDVSPRVSSVDE